MTRPDGISAVLKAAGGHPLRWQILTAMRAAPQQLSPNALQARLDQPLGNVSYHVRILADHGLIECVRTEPRRGALEHFYEITAEGKDFLAALDRLKRAIDKGRADRVSA